MKITTIIEHEGKFTFLPVAGGIPLVENEPRNSEWEITSNTNNFDELFIKYLSNSISLFCSAYYGEDSYQKSRELYNKVRENYIISK